MYKRKSYSFAIVIFYFTEFVLYCLFIIIKNIIMDPEELQEEVDNLKDKLAKT